MLTIRKRGKYFHVRGSIRVGRETRIVKEHSCGSDRRDDADAYRSKLEAEIPTKSFTVMVGGRTA